MHYSIFYLGVMMLFFLLLFNDTPFFFGDDDVPRLDTGCSGLNKKKGLSVECLIYCTESIVGIMITRVT